MAAEKLTRNILIPAERSHHRGTIRECHLVFGGRREQALQSSNGRIEHDGAFTTSLDESVHLVGIHQIGAHTMDKGWRCFVEILGTKDGA